MTADSGEIWCAWRRTSTPSTPGILMSVTITSKRALSILRLAASPPVTVSTLWPSRRRAISSISQVERPPAQRRISPPRPPPRSRRQRRCRGFRRGGSSASGAPLQTAQSHHEAGALANFRTRPHLALVRLHDLVHDRQAQPGSAFKVRLEGLEDFFRLLRVDAWTSVGKAHLPVGAALGQSHGQRSTFAFHRAHRVFREVPEHLFKLVAIGQHPGFGLLKAALQLDAGVLGSEAVFEQRKRVLHQRNQIHALETILRSEEHTSELQSLRH